MKKKQSKRASEALIVSLIDRIESVAKILEDLCLCVYGNGKIGLKEKMNRIEGALVLLSFLFGGGIIGSIVFFILTNTNKGGI